MLSINSSIDSLNSQRALTKTNRAVHTSMERLSSGLRINSASDDAAGLSIGTRMTSEIKGVSRSVANANDWISLIQTAEGGLNEMSNALQRIRELAVQSANDTNNDVDRTALNEEINQLIDEVDRIAQTTEFNGIKVLNGEIQNQRMQLGSKSDQMTSFSITKLDEKNLGRGIYGVHGDAVDTTLGFNNFSFNIDNQIYNIADSVAEDDLLSTSNAANSAIAKAATINRSLKDTGVELRVERTEFTTTATIPNATLTPSRYILINDVKISGFEQQANDADGTLVDAINAVTDDTGVIASVNEVGQLHLVAEDGRNIAYQAVGFGGLGLERVTGGKLRLVSSKPIRFTNPGDQNNQALGGVAVKPNQVFFDVSQKTTIHSLNISNRDEAIRTLTVLDFAFEDLNQTRAELGAMQNRLEKTINNLENAQVNLSASRSRIRDADFASETATMAQNQIIQQASVSILAQVNQQPAIALGLLQ